MGKERDHSKYALWIDPEKVIPYERNAKIHTEKQIENICNSIRRFGWQQDTVLTTDNVLVIGHGRRLAALKLGCEMPYHLIDKKADDLTDEDIRELRIADNQTNAETGVEWETLEAELKGLSFEGFDFDFGIEAEEEDTPTEEDFDYDAAPPAEPKAKRGDIYKLGNHRLMCGDATNPNDVDLLMGGEKADISITSPPYGESKSARLRDHYEPGKEKRTSLYESHADDIDEWLGLISCAFENMKAHSEGQFVNIQMLADNKTDLIDWLEAYKDSFVDVIIWDKMKAPPQMQSNVLNNQFEFVFVFCNKNNSRSVPFANFHGNVNNIFELSVGNNEFSDVHRAVFPVQFPTKIMEIAEKAETVLDLFGGTGTTMIAAEQIGRSCYMMELDPKYVDVIINRWEAFTGEKAVLLNG